jgi:hypothetical protein
MDRRPDAGRGRGKSVLLLLVLLALIACLVAWAFMESPTGAPHPVDTGVPQAMPG